jgi:hypothetical protein
LTYTHHISQIFERLDLCICNKEPEIKNTRIPAFDARRAPHVELSENELDEKNKVSRSEMLLVSGNSKKLLEAESVCPKAPSILNNRKRQRIGEL